MESFSSSIKSLSFVKFCHMARLIKNGLVESFYQCGEISAFYESESQVFLLVWKSSPFMSVRDESEK